MTINAVLVVDDSEIDQFLAKYVIEKYDENIEIIQAFDGREALDVLAKLPQSPSIILLDINMPRMNGHEFLAEYNTLEDHSARIFMLTSSEQDNDVRQAMSYNCVKRYLTKPIDLAELASIFQ